MKSLIELINEKKHTFKNITGKETKELSNELILYQNTIPIILTVLTIYIYNYYSKTSKRFIAEGETLDSKRSQKGLEVL